ncbi:MAG: sigma-70 family RNA polymerase sigma factor [Bacteroidetes bacterium]|nr:MAG: sigma-70 family RNA polymerase sigma factor [Bacteroidota bacterium]
MFGKKTLTEAELIKGCIDNDRRCQEILYKKYFPAMMRMCMRYTKDPEVALEIINNGFLRVFQKMHTYAFKGSFEGWIRRLVFHSLADHFKRTSKSIRFLDINDKDGPTSESVLNKLYYEDIVALIEHLKGTAKEVFWLFAVEGFSHAEIGDKLDISPGTSKWYLSEARKKLKSLVASQLNIKHHAG